jgi:hypothetical protein
MQNKIIKIAGIVFLFLLSNQLDAQIFDKIKKKLKETENKLEKKISDLEKSSTTRQATTPHEMPKPVVFEEHEYIDIPAINERFEDVQIQSFRGLPRLGTLYNYQTDNKSIPNYSERLTKSKADWRSVGKYTTLLQVKLMDDKFDQMDLEMPVEVKYPRGGPMGDKQVKTSGYCQGTLQYIATTLLKKEYAPDYFCNSSRPCDPKKASTSEWGGYGSNEFDKIKAYTAYINDNFQDILNTASKVPEEAYWVSTARIGQYDFNLKAFPIQFSLTRGFYTPENGYEEKLNGPSGHYNTTLSMSPAEAQKLLENHPNRYLYAVYKIKYSRHEITNTGLSYTKDGNPRNEFHLTSPIIELFEDIGLTKKIGEISLN